MRSDRTKKNCLSTNHVLDCKTSISGKLSIKIFFLLNYFYLVLSVSLDGKRALVSYPLNRREQVDFYVNLEPGSADIDSQV